MKARKKLVSLLAALLITCLFVQSFGPVRADETAVYEGTDYSAVYDYHYYRASYPDLAAAFGEDSAQYLDHFIRCGMSEGRRGNASFDVYSYKNLYADLRAAYGYDLKAYYMHYIRYGQAEGRITSGISELYNPITTYQGVDYKPVYNFDFYYSSNPDLQARYGKDDLALLKHFVEYGMAEGRQGSASFDVRSYRNKYPDLRGFYGSDLKSYYMHYMNYGRFEGRITTGVPEREGGITRLDGIDYAAVYDYQYYYSHNPDLRDAFGDDETALLKHFVNYGMTEGRKGNASFDVKSYRNQYQDLRLAFGSDLKKYYLHYINYGRSEGRITSGVNTLQDPVTVYQDVDFSPVYDFYYYSDTYADLKKAFGQDENAMLKHFVTTGIKEGRQGKADYSRELADALYDQLDPMNGIAQQYYSPTDYLLLVDLTRHKVGVYTGSQYNWTQIDSFPCTNGAPWTPTPVGEFQIETKFLWFDSGDARLWYASGFVGGLYLFHSILYYQEAGPYTIMDDTLSAAESHGCVRCRIDKAQWIYENVPYGTKVVTYH